MKFSGIMFGLRLLFALLAAALVCQAGDETGKSDSAPVKLEMGGPTNFDLSGGRTLEPIEGSATEPAGSRLPEKTDELLRALTSDEQRRWEAKLGQNAWRQTRALAAMFLVVMDEKIALTAAQREKLRPLAEELCRGQKGRFPTASQLGFYQVGTQLEDGELVGILDPVQVQYWRYVCEELKTHTSRAHSLTTRNVHDVPAPREPEELAAAVSDRFYEASLRVRKKTLAEAMLHSEAVIRVTALDEKGAEHLRTAARGFVENQMETWRNAAVEEMRSQPQNAAPADFPQWLESLEAISAQPFGWQFVSMKNKGVWERTMAAELTESQRAIWQKEIEAREDFRRRAIAVSVLAEFDRLCVLTPDQWEKLEPIFTEQINEYEPDMENLFRYSDNNAWWFMLPFYALTPVAGIPETTMRNILADAQWRKWTRSNQYSMTERYWNNIVAIHTARRHER